MTPPEETEDWIDWIPEWERWLKNLSPCEIEQSMTTVFDRNLDRLAPLRVDNLFLEGVSCAEKWACSDAFQDEYNRKHGLKRLGTEDFDLAGV